MILMRAGDLNIRTPSPKPYILMKFSFNNFGVIEVFSINNPFFEYGYFNHRAENRFVKILRFAIVLKAEFQEIIFP